MFSFESEGRIKFILSYYLILLTSLGDVESVHIPVLIAVGVGKGKEGLRDVDNVTLALQQPPLVVDVSLLYICVRARVNNTKICNEAKIM